MLCTKILGTLSDKTFESLRVDYVDIEWYETFSHLHRKQSAEGEDIGIRLEDGVLGKGLNQDDILYADAKKVIAVNIPACEAIRAQVHRDDLQKIARLCYEVGNTHTAMFCGEDDFTFYMPYYEPLFKKICGMEGVKTEKVMKKLEAGRALSSMAHHRHG